MKTVNKYSVAPCSKQAYGSIALHPTAVSHGPVTCFGQWSETESDVWHLEVEAFNCQHCGAAILFYVDEGNTSDKDELTPCRPMPDMKRSEK